MAGAHLMLAADLIRAVEEAGGHLEPDGDGPRAGSWSGT